MLKLLPCLLICCVSLLLHPRLAHAQRSRDPLTAAEEEQVREASDLPNDRVKLYIKFIEQRTEAIHATVRHPATQHPGADIHTSIEEYTRLLDELGDNLDAYDASHTDIRKSLHFLEEHIAKWPAALNEPASSPEYDFARKTALDATETTTADAKKLLKDQEEYFAKHKQVKNEGTVKRE